MKSVYIIISMVLVGCGEGPKSDVAPVAGTSSWGRTTPKAPVAPSPSPGVTTANADPIPYENAENRCLKDDQWFHQNDYGCFSSQANVTVGKERTFTIRNYNDSQLFLQICSQSTESNTLHDEWRLPTGDESNDFLGTDSGHLANTSNLMHFLEYLPGTFDMLGRPVPAMIYFNTGISSDTIQLTEFLNVEVNFAFNCVK